MEHKYQQELNQIQLEAVRHTEGALLVLAGAGSGKTKTLTYRIAYLVDDLGIRPSAVLAITFTNKAANEMRSRVGAICANASKVWVSTFHSLCVRILRRDIVNLGYTQDFTIYDSDDSQRLIKQCLAELRLNEERYSPKSVASAIGKMKDRLLSPKAAAHEYSGDEWMEGIAQIYEAYQRNLIRNDALDFDDIIMNTVRLFKTNPDVLEYYQARFRYIMVDEYQDTNQAQYELVRLLSAGHGNICVVGDDDQSIYAFRGANIQNILDFETDFPGARVLKLEQNYRSTKHILAAANAVISNNKTRKPKQLWTDDSGGNKPVFYHCENEWSESDFITRTIFQQYKAGRNFAGHAVLYRSGAMSRSIEEGLVRAGIPHVIVGGMRFYDRKEVRDILAYLRLIHNPRDSVSLMRIINVPRRGIGPATIERLMEFSQNRGVTLLEAIENSDAVDGLARRTEQLNKFAAMIRSLAQRAKELSVDELLERVIVESGYRDDIRAQFRTEEARGKFEHINELMAKSQEFVEAVKNRLSIQREDDEPGAMPLLGMASLSGFLEEVALVSGADEAGGGDAVTLMTLHASKGLEFDCVFLVGLEENTFPSRYALKSLASKEIEEERRLCYVGITRARQQLYISAAKSRRFGEKNEYNKVSRFVEEISYELLENGLRMNEENTMNEPKPGSTSKERTGISRYAEINKVRNSIDISFGGKNYMQRSGGKARDSSEEAQADFKKGDKVRQMKYGLGTVVDVKPAGADTELTVEFEAVGNKKFLASLSKLRKVEGE